MLGVGGEAGASNVGGTVATMGDTRKRGSVQVIAGVTGCAEAREAALVGAAQMKRPPACRQNACGRGLRGRARYKVGVLIVGEPRIGGTRQRRPWP